MSEQIAPGVWWLDGTRGCNVFLARAVNGGFVLFDAGFASSLGAIVREADAVRAGAPITHLLLTHLHFDHVGSAAALRRNYGCVVAAGAEDCAQDGAGTWSAGTQLGPSHRLLRVLSVFTRRLGRAAGPHAVVVGQPIVGEVEIAGVRAVPTPGHTPGSYCYLFPDGDVAFVGDMVISHRAP